VKVSFEHGPVREFDLIVRTDGLHSTVRRLAFGADRNSSNIGSITSLSRTRTRARRGSLGDRVNMPSKMAGIYRSGNHAEAKAYFMFADRSR